MTDWNKNTDIEWAGLPVSIHRYEGQPAAKVAPIILYLRIRIPARWPAGP